MAGLPHAGTRLKKRQGRRSPRRLPPPPGAPEARSGRADSAELRQRAPWDKGEGRAAIFELSEIVRVYLGKQLAFNAIDLTSEELLHALRLAQSRSPGSISLALHRSGCAGRI